MGKLVTLIFAENILKRIDAAFPHTVFFPEKFKESWFESIDYYYECKVENCRMDTDGLWVMDVPQTRGSHYHQKKFYWRIEPNYCTAGRPIYTSDEIADIFAKSETKKDIVKMYKSQICLEWDGFDMPTETCWGLRKRPNFITIYEDGKRIYKGLPMNQRGYKKHFIDFVMEYYKFKK